MGNVTPHGIGAGSQPRHLAQSASPDRSHVGRIGKTIFEHGAQSSGQKLGQMADPGTDLVMPGGQNVHGATAEAFHPSPPFGGQGMTGKLSEQPYSLIEELPVGVGGSAYFLPSHGMPGEKTGLAGAAEERERADRDRHFDAAHIGDQLMRLEMRSEFLHPVLNGGYRSAKKHEVAAHCCADSIAGDGIDRAALERKLRLGRMAVPTDNLTGKLSS